MEGRRTGVHVLLRRKRKEADSPLIFGCFDVATVYRHIADGLSRKNAGTKTNGVATTSKQQIPPLCFASVGMTPLLNLSTVVNCGYACKFG